MGNCAAAVAVVEMGTAVCQSKSSFDLFAQEEETEVSSDQCDLQEVSSCTLLL